MKRLFFSLLALVVAAPLWAQGPNGSGTYYRPANGKSGAELKTALHEIIGSPNVVSYSGLKAAYIKTDTRPDGFLRDFYSCVTQYVPGSDMAAGQYEGFNYNREHSVCQSWFKSVSPMYTDVVQVIPTDGYLNSRRNDNPFGEVVSDSNRVNTSAQGYSRWGAPRRGLIFPDSIAEKVTTVFEPNDEVKGDIARIYFYMATCYEDRATTAFINGKGAYVFNAEGTAYQPLQPWVHEMMMRWSAIDPVDSIETARNDSVFTVQGNRNPFVDYPGLEDYIWGAKLDSVFVYGDDSGVNPDEESAPTSGTIILNNAFFGVDWTGQRPSGGAIQMRGTQNGITVTYTKGESGQSMYCNDKQIRLYKYNELTFAVKKCTIQRIEFSVVKNDNAKEFIPTTGQMDGYTWTGDDRQVVFTVTDGNGNIQVASANVTVSEDTEGIEQQHVIPAEAIDALAVYTLTGIRVDASSLRPGIYVRGGRKFIVK